MTPHGERRAGARAMAVARHTTRAELASLLPEWAALHESTGAGNPFTHPVWIGAWLRRFVADDDMRVITVRRNGVLVAVAAFYVHPGPSLPGRPAARLELVGTGDHAVLTELPEILAAPGYARRALGAILEYLRAHEREWAWAKIAIGPGQGWFEPHWLPAQTAGTGHTVLHNWTHAAVTLDLPGSSEELRAGMKRNLKESLRRARNRLRAAGHEWSVERFDEPGAELDRALGQLSELHRRRAGMAGKIRHSDYLADGEEGFLLDVVPEMARSGLAGARVLEVGGVPAAAALVLRANRSIFFSLNGHDPAWWEFNLPTLLQAECLEEAVEGGFAKANLSVGPTVSKLRWSEEIACWNEFVVVGSSRRARAAHAVYAHRRLRGLLRDGRHVGNKLEAG